MSNHVDSILRFARHLLTWGALFISSALFAAGGPPTVEVQGVVEVINDVLRTPYVVTKTNANSGSTGGSQAAQVRFDVPAGKRLIVETVALRARLVAGQVPSVTAWANPTIGTEFVVADIVLTPQGTTDQRDIYKATLPLKLRVNKGNNFDLLFTLDRNTSFPGFADLRVTVVGYLVDVP